MTLHRFGHDQKSVSLGFPSELGDAVARHLGSPKAIDRMTAYLNCEKPTDADTVVDEMLAIRAEIDAWKRKKAAAESNSAYNDLLYYGLGALKNSENRVLPFVSSTKRRDPGMSETWRKRKPWKTLLRM